MMNPSSAIAYVKPTAVPDTGAALEVKEREFPAFRDMGNGLTVHYLVDVGEHFDYVQRADLEDNGMTVDELHDAAVGNLSELCQGVLEVREYGEIFAVTVDGCFEASALLLDRLWENSLKKTTRSGYVACIPSRDVLAYCDPSSSTGVGELRQVVERVWPDGDHLITETLYTRREGGWHPYNA